MASTNPPIPNLIHTPFSTTQFNLLFGSVSCAHATHLGVIGTIWKVGASFDGGTVFDAEGVVDYLVGAV